MRKYERPICFWGARSLRSLVHTKLHVHMIFFFYVGTFGGFPPPPYQKAGYATVASFRSPELEWGPNEDGPIPSSPPPPPGSPRYTKSPPLVLYKHACIHAGPIIILLDHVLNGYKLQISQQLNGVTTQTIEVPAVHMCGVHFWAEFLGIVGLLPGPGLSRGLASSELWSRGGMSPPPPPYSRATVHLCPKKKINGGNLGCRPGDSDVKNVVAQFS